MERTRMLLIDVVNNDVKVVTPKDYKEYHALIGCELFDIVRRHIGDNKKDYEIICDDMGWFENNPIPSALNGNEIMFVGNILISGNVDFEGELTSLTDEDIAHITNCVRIMIDFENGTSHPALVDVTY